MRASQSQKWICLGALVAGFVYLLLCLLEMPWPFDEGLIVTGAEQVLHGKVPYRDFAAYYTPGQIYSLAALFHVFGSSLLVERIWDACMRLALCVLVYLVARTLTSRRLALVPAITVLLYLGWCGYPAYPVFPAMVWALVAVYLLIRHRSDPKYWRVSLAGFAIGVCAFYRQDVGTYAFVSGAFLLLVPIAGNSPVSVVRADVASRWKSFLWYATGTCVIWFPVLAYFFWKVPMQQLWADFVELPRFQMQYRAVQFPPVFPSGKYLLLSLTLFRTWFLFYVPVAIFLISLVRLLRARFQPAPEPEIRRHRFAAALLTVFGLLLLITTITRADQVHCFAPTVPAAILFVPLIQSWPRRRAWGTASLALSLVVLGVPYVVAPIGYWVYFLHAHPPWSGTSTLARARYLHVPADQEAAVRFIRAHVPSGDPIFVGNAQNRRVFANDVIFYFLANRSPGTRYAEFEPGVVTAATVQRQMVAELERNQVHWVVLFSGYETELRKMSSTQEGSPLLDDYLRREFRPVATFDRYSILEKRNATTAPTALPPTGKRSGAALSGPSARNSEESSAWETGFGCAQHRGRLCG